VLTLRRPANPIGWLYAVSGLVWSLNVPGEAWVSDLVRDGRPMPLAAQLNAAVGEPLWAPAIALGVTLPLLLLPDGRLRSRRWRVAVAVSVAGATLAMAGILTPGQLTATPIDNPFGLAGPAGTVANLLATLGAWLHVGSLAAALVCLVLRFRASRGVQRQQLRWVAAGAGAAVAGYWPWSGCWWSRSPMGSCRDPGWSPCPGAAVHAGHGRGGGAALPAVGP
jgi:hypothetical protein